MQELRKLQETGLVAWGCPEGLGWETQAEPTGCTFSWERQSRDWRSWFVPHDGSNHGRDARATTVADLPLSWGRYSGFRFKWPLCHASTCIRVATAIIAIPGRAILRGGVVAVHRYHPLAPTAPAQRPAFPGAPRRHFANCGNPHGGLTRCGTHLNRKMHQ